MTYKPLNGTDKYFPGAIYWYNSTLRKCDYEYGEFSKHDFITSRPVMVVGNALRQLPASGFTYIRVIPITSQPNSLPHGSYPIGLIENDDSFVMPYIVTSVKAENLEAKFGMVKVSNEDYEQIMDAADFFAGRCEKPSWLEESFEKYGIPDDKYYDPYDDSYTQRNIQECKESKEIKAHEKNVVSFPVKEQKNISFTEFINANYEQGEGTLKFSDVYTAFNKASTRTVTTKAAMKSLGHCGFATTKISKTVTVLRIQEIGAKEEYIEDVVAVNETASTIKSETKEDSVFFPKVTMLKCPIDLHYTDARRKPKMYTEEEARTKIAKYGELGEKFIELRDWIYNASYTQKAWVMRACTMDAGKLVGLPKINGVTLIKLKSAITLSILPALYDVKTRLVADPECILNMDHDELMLAGLLSEDQLKEAGIEERINSINNFLKMSTGYGLFD